jgi:hypothetical protein
VSLNNHLEIHHLRIAVLKVKTVKKDLFQNFGEYRNLQLVRNPLNNIVETRFTGGGRIENVKFTKKGIKST